MKEKTIDYQIKYTPPPPSKYEKEIDEIIRKCLRRGYGTKPGKIYERQNTYLLYLED